jgi:hypothetical protein
MVRIPLRTVMDVSVDRLRNLSDLKPNQETQSLITTTDVLFSFTFSLIAYQEVQVRLASRKNAVRNFIKQRIESKEGKVIINEMSTQKGNQVEMTIKVDGQFTARKQETLAETSERLLNLKNFLVSTQTLGRNMLETIEQDNFETIQDGGMREFELSTTMVLALVRKLKAPELKLSDEEEVAVIKKRKQDLELTAEEKQFIKSRRRKEKEEIEKKADFVEEKEEKKGIFRRAVDFIAGLFG